MGQEQMLQDTNQIIAFMQQGFVKWKSILYRKVFICCRGYYQNWQIFCPKFTKQNLSFITATIQGRLLFKGGN